MNHKLILYAFENQQVRMVLIDGEPWFIARDVGDVLGISKVRNTLSSFPESERRAHTMGIRSQNGVIQEREMLIVNEPGLYRLIFQGRKPDAERFKTWVFTEVLPQIRKTGAYIPEPTKQDITDLQTRVLELEINRTVTEKLLLRAERTIQRYQEQRLMTYADKRDILNLRLNNYRISDIQRITKKSRNAIKRFLDWLADLDDAAFEGEIEKIKRAGRGQDMGELLDRFIAASQGYDGGAV